MDFHDVMQCDSWTYVGTYLTVGGDEEMYIQVPRVPWLERISLESWLMIYEPLLFLNVVCNSIVSSWPTYLLFASTTIQSKGR